MAFRNDPKGIAKYDKPFPKFKKPKILGHYSKDEMGEVRLNDSGKKYLRLGNLYSQINRKLNDPLDLSYDQGLYIAMDEQEHPVPHILPWIREHRDQLIDKNNNRLKDEFVISGGSFKWILMSPYVKDKQIFNIFKLNSTYYVFQIRMEPVFNSDHAPVMGNMGHKFESTVTSPDCDGEPDPLGLVNENKQYYHVLQTKMGEHKILYSANIDCVDLVKESDSDATLGEEPIELCVVRGNLERLNSFSFKRYKMLDYWCKAFVAGIERTVCGFRNDDFVVTEMTIFKTSTLPQEAHKNIKNNMWLPNVCGNFCDDFLTYVKSVQMEERTFYEIVYTERGNFQSKEIGSEGSHRFPEWYTDIFGNA